ncbi:MAG TPA: SDR family oxidoreductase [Thermoanaerobaculia bacterium]|nr:SDR family oxidoreductase [Thermoanaerobaculia bacterium]
MRGLAGKRVVITGGASGIGAATVERFLQEGARVAVIDRDAEAGRALRRRHPNLAGVIEADVADPAAVDRAFRELDGLLGGPDVTINNAGISIRHDFMDITPAEWRRVMSVDIDGVFYVAQQSARRMLAGAGGVILNMGSTSGMNGYPRYADYNAAKAGVIELTRTMALELAPKIRVVAVCPGYVWTAMQEAEYTAEMKAAVDAKIPLRRHAAPAEIAALFAFLASDEAPYITGHPVIIDGGEIAGGLASR